MSLTIVQIEEIAEKYGFALEHDNNGQIVLYTDVFDPEYADDDSWQSEAEAQNHAELLAESMEDARSALLNGGYDD